MKMLVTLILSCFAGIAFATPARIVGGTNVTEGQFPYQVSLRAPNHFCGGSILNKRWILTAAHCVKRKSSEHIKVVAGTVLLNGGKEQVYQAQYRVWHRRFRGSHYRNNIALIRVDRDIEFNDRVQPIDLPTRDYGRRDEFPAVLTGWGSTHWPPNSFSNNLQKLNLTIIPRRNCKRNYHHHHYHHRYHHHHHHHHFRLSRKQICTLPMAGKGACRGDSGSPLVADGVQVGIVPYRTPCATGRPGIFTSVYAFRRWIKNKMRRW